MKRAIAVVFMMWSSTALAQPAGAQAEVLFRQGRDLLAAGKVAEACSAFQESQKLEPAVTTLLNLAGCREKLGQIATAWGLFLDAARQTRSAGDTASQQLHDLAQGRAQKLEPRVSRLTINVPQKSQVDGLEISRDKDRVEAGLWNRALPIDGGTYTITARAPGSSPWSTQVTIAPESDTRTVEIPDLRNLPHDLDKPAPAAAPPPSAPPRASPVVPAIDHPPAASHPSRTVPVVLGVGGLALLGGGLGFELWAQSKYDAAKSEVMSQSRRDSLQDAANTRRYVAEGLAVSGVVAGGVAVWLYLRGGSRERDAMTDTSIHVVPTTTGLSVSGRF
ncbi:MAG TPA: tetratricopeptide repeat protein [Kofleriaceae bacterium]|jgi:hypothetical protein|nr:tetratricopeptide repeat protein [Kofleriaceae bacterium]